MKVWCLDPQSGGNKIPSDMHEVIAKRVQLYSLRSVWYPKFKIKLRYRNQFCYLDASENGQADFPIGRLRYFDINRWSLAFYAYSSESYKPCLFNDGGWFGTVEQAIDICSLYFE